VDDDYRKCSMCGRVVTCEASGVEVHMDGTEHECLERGVGRQELDPEELKTALFEHGSVDAIRRDFERDHFHDHCYGW
jgi:hypothetical protein